MGFKIEQPRSINTEDPATEPTRSHIPVPTVLPTADSPEHIFRTAREKERKAKETQLKAKETQLKEREKQQSVVYPRSISETRGIAVVIGVESYSLKEDIGIGVKLMASALAKRGYEVEPVCHAFRTDTEVYNVVRTACAKDCYEFDSAFVYVSGHGDAMNVALANGRGASRQHIVNIARDLIRPEKPLVVMFEGCLRFKMEEVQYELKENTFIIFSGSPGTRSYTNRIPFLAREFANELNMVSDETTSITEIFERVKASIGKLNIYSWDDELRGAYLAKQEPTLLTPDNIKVLLI